MSHDFPGSILSFCSNLLGGFHMFHRRKMYVSFALSDLKTKTTCKFQPEEKQGDDPIPGISAGFRSVDVA